MSPVNAEHGPCPDPLELLGAVYLGLTPNEREALNTFVECWHRHDSQAALADLVKRGLRAVVNEDDEQDDEAVCLALLAALDIEPEAIARLQRVAAAQFDGSLTWALSEAIEGAFAEAWEGDAP